MKIKYLLSGRLLSDISHCRKLIDSWPLDIPFPDVVEDIKGIKENEIVFTKGYLGQSANLIRNHNPQNVFIFDNAIFPSKGISNFRILDGNLNSLIKNNEINYESYFDYYLKKVSELFEKLDYEKDLIINSSPSKESNANNSILIFPWSLPLKKIIEYKNKKELNDFDNKIKDVKIRTNALSYEYEKLGNIIFTSSNNIPLIRTYKKNKKLETYLFNSQYLICPTSSLALMGLINRMNIYMSKYNPYNNFLINNPNFKNYNNEKLKIYLSSYISKINFSISDLYKGIEEGF